MGWQGSSRYACDSDNWRAISHEVHSSWFESVAISSGAVIDCVSLVEAQAFRTCWVVRSTTISHESLSGWEQVALMKKLQKLLSMLSHTGEALCGETGFCCGFWTPNWCPQKSLFFHSLKEQKVGKTNEI